MSRWRLRWGLGPPVGLPIPPRLPRPEALEALRASGGAALRAQLGALVAMPEGPDAEPGAQLPGRPVSLWRRAHESRSQRAVDGASWLREPVDARGTAEDGAHDEARDSAHDEARSSTRPRAAPKLLRQPVRLLLIEPEGVLKKQCNVSVVDDAQAAQSKRRRSLYGAARHDAFFMPETLRAEIVTNREAGTYQGDPNDPRMVELQGVQIRQVRAW